MYPNNINLFLVHVFCFALFLVVTHCHISEKQNTLPSSYIFFKGFVSVPSLLCSSSYHYNTKLSFVHFASSAAGLNAPPDNSVLCIGNMSLTCHCPSSEESTRQFSQLSLLRGLLKCAKTDILVQDKVNESLFLQLQD